MKPIDPSSTPWDFSTWGYYCDTCERFFDSDELNVLLPEPNICTYEHKTCGKPARYIGYDHSKCELGNAAPKNSS